MASGVKFSRGELVKSTKAQDFHLSHKFGLEVDAITVNGVHSIENIALEFEIVEYADGEDKTPHCRPGINHPGQVTIRRDFSGQKDWFNWRNSVVKGETDRRSVSIIFHNDKGEEARRLNLFNCYATKWNGPSLNSKASGHATESLDLMFEEWKLG